MAGVPVGRPAAALHFLHGTGWKSPLDTIIGQYLVHYANGAEQSVFIHYGRDVRDWWTDTSEIVGDELQVAWTGENHSSPGGPELRLYQTRWENAVTSTTEAQAVRIRQMNAIERWFRIFRIRPFIRLVCSSLTASQGKMFL